MALPSYRGDESHHDKGAPLLIFPGSFPAEQQADGPGEYHAAARQFNPHFPDHHLGE